MLKNLIALCVCVLFGSTAFATDFAWDAVATTSSYTTIKYHPYYRLGAVDATLVAIGGEITDTSIVLDFSSSGAGDYWLCVTSIGYSIGYFTDINVTPDSDNDLFTASSHGLANGTIVKFSCGEGCTVPSGVYSVNYIINATTNTFQISATDGGSPIDITDVGVGTIIASGSRIESTYSCSGTCTDTSAHRSFYVVYDGGSSYIKTEYGSTCYSGSISGVTISGGTMR